MSSFGDMLNGSGIGVGGSWVFLFEGRRDGCRGIIEKRLAVGYSTLPPDRQFIFHCPRRLLPGGPCEARIKMP